MEDWAGAKKNDTIDASLAILATRTPTRAGIVLTLESPGDRRFWLRLNSTIQHFNMPIDTWSIGPSPQ